MSEKDKPIPSLRSGPETGAAGGEPLATPFGVSESVELVVDLLAATKLVPPDRLALARGRAQQTRSLAAALVEEGVASSEGIARMLAARHQLPLVDLALVGVDERGGEGDPAPRPRARRRNPVRRRRRRAPHRRRRSGEPARHRRAPARDAAVRSSSASPRARTSSARSASSRAPPRRSARARSPTRRRTSLAEDEEDVTDLEAEDGVSDVPLVRLVNSILFQAAEDGASDIHFEPQEDALVVRFRIDGVLQEMQRIPKRLMPGVTTRLKVLAKLDIAERRKPQDGRISLNAAAAGRMLDVRVATLPTVEGESLVMRLLDKSKKPPTLEELGLSDEMRATLSEIVDAADRRAARHRPDRFR